MKNYSLRDVAEMIGIFSIVLGLLMVAYELRQNSQLMRAQVFNERSTQGIDVFLAIAQTPELSEIDARLRSSGFPDDPAAFSELTDVQQRQYAWLLRADRFRLENILYQQVLGVMEHDPGHLRGARDLIKRYDAVGAAGYPYAGHRPTHRLEQFVVKLEEAYGSGG